MYFYQHFHEGFCIFFANFRGMCIFYFLAHCRRMCIFDFDLSFKSIAENTTILLNRKYRSSVYFFIFFLRGSVFFLLIFGGMCILRLFFGGSVFLKFFILGVCVLIHTRVCINTG